MKFRFFNTFEPVIPLFHLLLPHVERSGHAAEAWIADREYRGAGSNGTFRARTIPTWAPRSKSGSGRKAFIHLSYSVVASLLSLFGPKVACSVFLTQPSLFAVWPRVLKALRREPHCLITMDLYPLVAIEAGVMRRRGVVSRLTEAVAVTVLRGADHVTVIGRCMARRVRDWGTPPERIHTICNWADTDSVQPVPKAANAMLSCRGLEDRFIVMYSGNLGVSHSFDDLLAVADHLRDQKDLLFFVSQWRDVEGLAGAILRARDDAHRALAAYEAVLTGIRRTGKGGR